MNNTARYYIEGWNGLNCTEWAFRTQARAAVTMAENLIADGKADRVYIRRVTAGKPDGVVADRDRFDWNRVDDPRLAALIGNL